MCDHVITVEPATCMPCPDVTVMHPVHYSVNFWSLKSLDKPFNFKDLVHTIVGRVFGTSFDELVRPFDPEITFSHITVQSSPDRLLKFEQKNIFGAKR